LRYTNKQSGSKDRAGHNLQLGFAALRKQPKIHDVRESNFRFHVVKEGPVVCASLTTQVARAKFLRLAQETAQRSAGKLESIEALRPNNEDKNFELLAQEVRAAIANGKAALGLDRLHTFTVRYIRNSYEKQFDAVPNQTATPNALLGQIANDLRSKGIIKSAMASEILKSASRVLEEFNRVRNNQTFAHANEEVLPEAEATFIYANIAASIRFLQTLGF
jgi:hypothetical protein